MALIRGTKYTCGGCHGGEGGHCETLIELLHTTLHKRRTRVAGPVGANLTWSLPKTLIYHVGY
jgi:hypothetical protein